jgi:hypothetical protein
MAREDPLIRYVRRPSRRRLEAAVREHYEFVWRCALRVTGRDEDAADICQDVFLKLQLHPDKAATIRSPRGYLAQGVIIRAFHARRSAERRKRWEEEAAKRSIANGGGEMDLPQIDAGMHPTVGIHLDRPRVFRFRDGGSFPLDQTSGAVRILCPRPSRYPPEPYGKHFEATASEDGLEARWVEEPDR